jgi:hypothetical protein
MIESLLNADPKPETSNPGNSPAGNAAPAADTQKSGGDLPAWKRPVTEFLPDDLRSDPLASKYPNVVELFKGLKEANGLIGKKTEGMVRIPTEQSTPEEKSAFLKSIGVPDKPENYALPKLGDGVTVDPGLEKWFRETGHKHGLTGNQFSALVADYTALEQQQLQQSVSALQAHYGDKYGDAVKAANAALGKLPKDMQDIVNKSRDVTVFYVLEQFGRLLGEDAFPLGDQKQSSTAADQERLLEINNELRKPDVKNNGKLRKELMDEKVAIMKRLG